MKFIFTLCSGGFKYETKNIILQSIPVKKIELRWSFRRLLDFKYSKHAAFFCGDSSKASCQTSYDV